MIYRYPARKKRAPGGPMVRAARWLAASVTAAALIWSIVGPAPRASEGG